MTEKERPRGLFEAPFQVERPEKVSQSLMARLDVCPYSGALYLKYRKENVQTHRMAGGEMLHAVLEQLTKDVLDGEEFPPPEVAKDMAQAMMEKRVDLALTADEQEGVRTAVWNWATATMPDPETIVGVEVMLEMELAGWIHRGKLDLCEIIDRDGRVTDYKSTMRLPTVEEFRRNFQGQDYALLMAEGTVEGTTQQIGQGLQGIETVQVFPRYRPELENGRLNLVQRDAYYTRQQLFDFKVVLMGHLKKLEHGLETQEWAAATGPHCSTCPAAQECPIPATRRPKVISTDDEARALAEAIPGRKRDLEADREALKDRVNEHGPLDAGAVTWDFEFAKKEVLAKKDKAALKEKLEELGVDPADYFKVQKSTTLKAKPPEEWGSDDD